MKIFQVLTVLSFGDAIGNHTLALERLIREMGVETGIYAEVIDSRLPKGSARDVREIPELREEDIVIYHLSTGTDLNREIAGWNCKKVINYHNITPPAFFNGYNLKAKHNSEKGLQDALYLADKVDYCIAVSEFNKSELVKMGYRVPIDVAPILIPWADYDRPPSKAVMDRYGDGKANLLFVGRVAPNKKQEDIIKAFYYYKRYMNPDSRLFIVGNYAGMERYHSQLKEYADVLGLEDIHFLGHIRFDEILAYYHLADLFVCMSEHEGFCVPLLEAMYFKTPILAYQSSAVSETLGEGGILLDEKDARLTAEWMYRLISDQALRDDLLEKQEGRIQDYQYERVADLFKQILENVMGESR